MKLNKTLTALAIGASFGLSGQAFAAGTPATTLIKNTATMSYKVNDTSVPSTSTEAQFAVDYKVDLTLSSTNSPSGNPGTNENLIFTLKNDGNSTQFFKLNSTQTTPTFYLSSDDSVITNRVISLNIDESVSFYMPASIADDAENGATVTYEVEAIAVDDAAGTNELTESTDNKNATPTSLNESFIVFAEATTDSVLTLANGDTRDGGYVVEASVSVNAPELTSTKTVTVNTSTITDSSGETFTTNYAIPGATVTYTVVVNNTGAVDAQGVKFVDNLATNAPQLDFATIKNITVLDNADTTLTAGTNYIVNNDGTDAGEIDLSLPDLAQSEKMTIRFEVDIK